MERRWVIQRLLINRVCEKTLMYAFQKQNRLIDDYMVKYVAEHELISG